MPFKLFKGSITLFLTGLMVSSMSPNGNQYICICNWNMRVSEYILLNFLELIQKPCIVETSLMNYLLSIICKQRQGLEERTKTPQYHVILILQINSKHLGFIWVLYSLRFSPPTIIIFMIVESTEHIWVPTTIKISSSESKTATEQRSTVSQE